MPVPMVDQPCKIGVQVHDRGPVSQPWIGLSHAYSSLFFVYAGSNYTLNWCPPQAKRAICRVILLEPWKGRLRSEEHTSELQSLMRISYAVFCLKKKKQDTTQQYTPYISSR